MPEITTTSDEGVPQSEISPGSLRLPVELLDIIANLLQAEDHHQRVCRMTATGWFMYPALEATRGRFSMFNDLAHGGGLGKTL